MKPALLARFCQVLKVPEGRLTARATFGGDINQAYRLGDGESSWFVKVNHASKLAMFEAESRGLRQIARANAIRVPAVLDLGVHEEQSYLLLEFIELRGQPEPQKLALALAALHHHCSDSFGNDFHNTIGSTPQKNTREGDWLEFWRAHRLGFQIQLLGDGGFDSGLVKRLESLQQKLDGLFSNYQPEASLLHGDLWSGNWAADDQGQPVIYDPACYFGDHEADLAMMELFGNPGERFFLAYENHFAIDDGYPQRKQLYNLYHIVNHALLFGGGYSSQASRMADQLLAELR